MIGYLPSAWNTKSYYINRWGMNYWKWNASIYIPNCFRITYVIIFCQMVSSESFSSPSSEIRKRAEYGFGEHGFKHRTQSVPWPSPSSGQRAQWVCSAYGLCAQANSPSFSQNSPNLPQNWVSYLVWNRSLETVFRPFPRNAPRPWSCSEACPCRTVFDDISDQSA